MVSKREDRAQRLKRLKQAGAGRQSGRSALPPSPQCAVVLEALKAHKLSVSLGELARELEQEALYCWKKLNLLRKRKLVKRVGHGRYIATKEVK